MLCPQLGSGAQFLVSSQKFKHCNSHHCIEERRFAKPSPTLCFAKLPVPQRSLSLPSTKLVRAKSRKGWGTLRTPNPQQAASSNSNSNRRLLRQPSPRLRPRHNLLRYRVQSSAKYRPSQHFIQQTNNLRFHVEHQHQYANMSVQDSTVQAQVTQQRAFRCASLFPFTGHSRFIQFTVSLLEYDIPQRRTQRRKVRR